MADTKTGSVKRHRRWVVHSHEAARPDHMESKADINITPLIDVMLVLLIIFMVVTPLAQKGVDIALPQASNEASAPSNPSNQVVLGVEDSPSGPVVTVNKSPVANMAELENRLRDIYQTRSDKTIFVKGSGKVLYGKVVEAMDAARGAGVERIGIMTEQMVNEAAPVSGGTGN
ncbi:MAG TPA: biopolymer transporter ExbD [Vicinamibacteria bacterium]